MRKLAIAMALALAACGSDSGNKGPITIALLTPETGALTSIGISFEKVFRVAADNINAQGGVDGRQLALVVVDTETNADTAGAKLQTAIDMGAVAAVGPATSGEVTNAYPIAAVSHVPIISPSSTAPTLSSTTLSPPDDGFMFRNVPDDSIQGIAMAYYLGTKRTPTVANVAVLYENSPYGDGLRASFVGVFTGAKTGGKVPVQVSFTQNTDAAGATAAISSLAQKLNAEAAPPKIIVMIALEKDAIKLANAWSASNDPVFTGTSFFMTDGARSSGFLTGAPTSVRGMCGTAPTFPVNGLAYQSLKTAYEAKNPGEKLEDQVYAPNVWDATHLLAAAMVQQMHDHSGEDVGGADLREAITAASKSGQTVRADQWRTLISDVHNGTDIDYDGAAGPNDFDVVGQAIGPYEVWCISADGSTFTQALFLDAQDLEKL
jgi:ABC-type branched-subunit amino acid transport system substrate-binding protein